MNICVFTVFLDVFSRSMCTWTRKTYSNDTYSSHQRHVDWLIFPWIIDNVREKSLHIFHLWTPEKRDHDFNCAFIKCCLVISEPMWISTTALYANESMNYAAPLVNSQWLSCLTFLILLDVSFQQMVLNGYVYTITLIIVQSWLKAKAFLLAHENNTFIMPPLRA